MHSAESPRDHGGVAIVSTVLFITLAWFLPLPGVDHATVSELFSTGYLPRFLEWAELRIGVFPSLEIYVLLQLILVAVARDLRRVLAALYVLFAAVGGFATALWLEDRSLAEHADIVPDPGIAFRVTTALTHAACAATIWWVGEWVTSTSRHVYGPLLVIATAEAVALPLALVKAGRVFALGGDGWDACASLIVPVSVGLVLLVAGVRAKGGFPIVVGTREVLRSSFDLACLPFLGLHVGGSIVWMVSELWLGAALPPLDIVAALVIAVVACTLFVRHARTRGRPSARTIVAGALVLLVGPVPFLVAFAASDGFANLGSGPLTGHARYTLVLTGSSPNVTEDANALCARIEALGATARVVSVARDRITLAVSDAVSSEALPPVWAAGKVEARIVRSPLTDDLPLGLYPDEGALRGECDVVRAFVASHDAVYAFERTNELECSAVALDRQALFSSADIVDATAETEDDGSRALAMELDDDAAARFARSTAANVGRRLAIVVDGEILTAPTIMESIPGGRIRITLETPRFAPSAVDALAVASAPATRTRGTWTFAGVR